MRERGQARSVAVPLPVVFGGLLIANVWFTGAAFGPDRKLLQANAWQQGAGVANYTYPEFMIKEVMAKHSTAICFSGGGTRAMVAAFGQLQALHQLGLIKKTRCGTLHHNQIGT